MKIANNRMQKYVFSIFITFWDFHLIFLTISNKIVAKADLYIEGHTYLS